MILRLHVVETEGMTWSASNARVKNKLLQGQSKIALEDQGRINYLGKLLEQRDQLKYAVLEEMFRWSLFRA